MDSKFNQRAGIIVWMHTLKYVNKLKRFGLMHYVSKKMKYAVVYVNQSDVEKMIKTISKQHFVKKVELSHNHDVDFDFDHVLEGLNNKIIQQEKEKKEDSVFKLQEEFNWSGK